MPTPIAAGTRLEVTDRPFYTFAGATYCLDEEEAPGVAPTIGDVVTVPHTVAPDEDGDLDVDFGGYAFHISTDVLRPVD